MSVNKKYLQDPLFLYSLAQLIEAYLKDGYNFPILERSEELTPLTNNEHYAYGSRDYYLARLYIMEAFYKNPPFINVANYHKPFDFIDICAMKMICPNFQTQSNLHPFESSDIFKDSFVVEQVKTEPDYTVNLLKRYYDYLNLSRSSVLHLGCGWGTLSHVLKDDFSCAILTDLDICLEMLSLSPADIKVQQDAIHYMHKHPNTYDVVTCHGLLRYIPPKKNKSFLSAVKNTLHPNGFFVISEVDNPKNQIDNLPIKVSDGFIKVKSRCQVFRNSVFYKSVLRYYDDAMFHEEVKRVATDLRETPAQILAHMSGYKRGTQSLVVGRVRE